MTQTTNRFLDDIAKLMTDAAGAAKPATHRLSTAIREMAQRPPPKKPVRGVAAGEAMDGPNCAVAVEVGTEGEFVFAAPTPGIAKGLEAIGSAVAVCIEEARYLALLSRVKHAVAECEPEHFREAAGK